MAAAALAVVDITEAAQVAPSMQLAVAELVT
jgi:hypothetical protein